MANTENPTVQKPFSFSLMHSAKKGKFTTGRTTPEQAAAIDRIQEATAATKGAEDTSAKTGASVAEAPPAKAPTLQAQKTAIIAMNTQDQPALEPGRTDINSESFVAASFARKDLLITASAAKTLTKLFSALAMEPGSGNEVPLAIREKVLSNLIKESHVLADKISLAATRPGERVSIYLRAKVLQQAAEFISDKWMKDGIVSTEKLYETARAAFSGKVEGLSQEVCDLFHQAGEYTPATDQEISQARITESVIRASWRLLSTIQSFDIADYDESLLQDKSGGLHPYSYGREPSDVARDLTNIALSITKENRLDVNHLDLATTWEQNALDRATTLIAAEYRLHTDRALRSSFLNELVSEAALNSVAGLYDAFISRIHKRARNSFILIEKNALDVMSANAYKHYVPRVSKTAQQSTETSAPVTRQAESVNEGVAKSAPAHTQAVQKAQAQVIPFPPTERSAKTSSPDLEQAAAPKAPRRFTFGNPNHA